MRIDSDGNIELTAEENQNLMDQLGIPADQYDDPPVALEYLDAHGQAARFKATHTQTGKTVCLI